MGQIDLLIGGFIGIGSVILGSIIGIILAIIYIKKLK